MVALDRAAEIIERHGWCRDEFQDGEGRVCLEFALLVARGPDMRDARRLVEDELARRGWPGCPLVDWNDLYAAGELEVLDVLRTAARAARARPVPPATGGSRR